MLKIEGIISDITFHSDESGFTVMDVECAGELVTVVGETFGAGVGMEVTAYGDFVSHSVYGQQFKAFYFEQTMPAGAVAIYKYLASGAIRGIGEATARKIVDIFGDDTLNIFADDPKQLAKVKGISEEKAKAIGADFAQLFGLRETIAFLSAYGVSVADCVSIYRYWGAMAKDILLENPYLLCGMPAELDFDVADAIAHRLGFEDFINPRTTAGLIYVLRHNLNNGHTCVPREKLIEVTVSFLDADEECVTDALERGLEEERFVSFSIGDEQFIYLYDIFEEERYISARIKELAAASAPGNGSVQAMLTLGDIAYADRQMEAISAADSQSLVVITGGPGTGKTTTINGILELFERRGLQTALTAPTGRAAKRMTELTGRKAQTIHRLLEVDFNFRETGQFVRNEANPLKADAVIVDEMSMVDVHIFCSLLRALKSGCKLVLVGDSNQLPSVGPGNILLDIINSGICTTVELTEIFRQAAESLIVVNSHKIMCGEMPNVNVKDKDFFFIENGGRAAMEEILELVSRRLPARYEFASPEEIQLICPSKLNMLGTANLNEQMRNRINPGDAQDDLEIIGRRFRVNDRVIQTRNNYDLPYTDVNGEDGIGVFNGDIGVVEDIDKLSGTMTVSFDDKTVEYSTEDAKELELAYAITVHKAQGSEFDTVIIPLFDIPQKLCYRNLIYTALTRAKKLLVIVGSKEVLRAMIDNDKRSRRYTGLKRMLEDEGV